MVNNEEDEEQIQLEEETLTEEELDEVSGGLLRKGNYATVEKDLLIRKLPF